jgi:hypothetical protein
VKKWKGIAILDLHRSNLSIGKTNRPNNKVAVAIYSVARTRRIGTAGCRFVVLVKRSGVAGRGDTCRSGRRVDL